MSVRKKQEAPTLTLLDIEWPVEQTCLMECQSLKLVILNTEVLISNIKPD